MISKELVKEVLDTNDKFIVEGNEVIFWSGRIYRKDRETFRVNIYELANKCKKWADVFHVVSIYSKVDFNGGVAYIITAGRKTKKFFEDSEAEAVFKACEWILEKKICEWKD